MRRGMAKDRTSTRRRHMLAACALVLLALPGTAGCGGGSSSEDDAAAAARRRAAAAHARAMATGSKVFARHCQSCHTLSGERYTDRVIEWEAPNLDEVRLKRHYVRFRVEFGGPAMASFSSEIPDAEREALIDYVTETAGRNVVDEGDQDAAQVDAGREVFAQNCATCHAIEGRTATGNPVYIGVDFNLVKPSARLVRSKAFHGVAPDVGIMPSFGRALSSSELEDVAVYVNAVAAEGREAPRTPFDEIDDEPPPPSPFE